MNVGLTNSPDPDIWDGCCWGSGGGGEIDADISLRIGLFDGLNEYENMFVGLDDWWSPKQFVDWFWTFVIVGDKEPTEDVSLSEPVDMLKLFMRDCCKRAW